MYFNFFYAFVYIIVIEKKKEKKEKTFAQTNARLISFLPPMLNMSIVSFFNSQSTLNISSAPHKIVLNHIAQSLISGFAEWNCIVGNTTVPQHHY